MTREMYIGVDGVARKVKKVYVGVNGVARLVKAGYVGVDGVARPFIGAAVSYTVSYVANGGSGSMTSQTASSTVVLSANAFAPAAGRYFTGWNTKADGSGTSYSAGQTITLSSDLTLYAQWAVMYYTVTYRHKEESGLHGSGDTGPMECYALWIDGVEQSDLGAFSNGARTYTLPYGTSIGVVVQTKSGSANSWVQLNGSRVTDTSTDARYGFTLTSNVDILFEWNYWIENWTAHSCWNCYITTS